MAAIGVDIHRYSLATCAIRERKVVLTEGRFSNDRAGHAAVWATMTLPGARVTLRERTNTFRGPRVRRQCS